MLKKLAQLNHPPHLVRHVRILQGVELSAYYNVILNFPVSMFNIPFSIENRALRSTRLSLRDVLKSLKFFVSNWDSWSS